MSNNAVKRWCFTINNYNDEIVDKLKNVDTSFITYMVCGFETAPETNTPHLQCYVELKKRLRRNQVKTKLLGNFEGHFTICNGTTDQNVTYCKKDGDFFEVGARTENHSGQRTDLEAFKECVKQHGGKATYTEMRELHSEVAAKYPQFFVSYINDVANESAPIIEGTLRNWQLHLKTILDGEPDDRKIIFVVDTNGNTGKTWFSHYMIQHSSKKAQVLAPGKHADMAFALMNNPDIVIIDAPRSKQGDYLQYDFIEAVKNGYVFSSKYESRYKRFKHPHVVVMMNEPPSDDKLSKDRYQFVFPDEYPDDVE